jgi:SAM-dependent methyltransferase
MSVWEPVSSSYRDPAGFMIADHGVYKRVVTAHGMEDYELYLASGLHEELTRENLTLDFREEATLRSPKDWVRLLVPDQLEFVSYPFEWSFDQLKDAALLTLRIQSKALARGLSLKDASPFNVQFRGAKPVFIDTLSFQRRPAGPWIAYEQFCKHFLAPLFLMSYVEPDANRQMKVHLDGFPLDRTSRLLPLRSYLRSGALLHIHLHARALRGKSEGPPQNEKPARDQQIPLIESLQRTVEGLRAPDYASNWTNYYDERRFYSGNAWDSKRAAVRMLGAEAHPSTVADLGANTGQFAAEFAERGARCLAFDSDAGCVNHLYLEEKKKAASRVLPLVMDLANPSPALGFGLSATLSIFERVQTDLVLCLGLLHHLRFRENVPLSRVAAFLARLGRRLVIEFVPPEDPSTILLRNGRPGFEDYTPSGFRESFGQHYRLRNQRAVEGSGRTLYLFERRAE